MPNLDELREPSLAEKGDRLLRHFSMIMPTPGMRTSVGEARMAELCGETWCRDNNELRFLAEKYLKAERGFLSGTFTLSEWNSVEITSKGWAHLQTPQQTILSSDSGFVAMWFDRNLDPISDAIADAIGKTGYRYLRIDKLEHNNRIDAEIIAAIRRSRFVVADFTGQRGGVYFETGLAVGLGLEVIWVCREDELSNVHFDNRQYNFITWQSDKLEVFKARLQKRIVETVGIGPLPVAMPLAAGTTGDGGYWV
jgi:nucleoside 2-deoxyribosyltransferase